MSGNTPSTDDELKMLLIENAKLDSRIKQLDIDLKQLELRHKPGFWKSVLASPAFLAALIAILATAATASVSWIIAAQQRQLDAQKSATQLEADKERNVAIINVERTKLQASLLSGMVLAIKPGESCPVADQLMAFLGAGVFTDEGFRQEANRMLNFYMPQCKQFHK
jgi:hypothetical protein